MRNAAVLNTLLDHQHRILAHLADIAPLVAAARPLDVTGVACRRWRLTRLLREYQLFKHRVVFDPTIALPDPILRDQAARMKARCIAMGEAFHAHAVRWGDGAAAERRDEYRRAVIALIADLRAHIAREADGVAALLAHPRYVEGR